MCSETTKFLRKINCFPFAFFLMLSHNWENEKYIYSVYNTNLDRVHAVMMQMIKEIFTS